MPASPPSFRATLSTDFVSRVFGKLSVDPALGYIHWDRLRRLPAPTGFTHEEWWTVIKLSRFNMHAIPLQAVDGAHFSFYLPDQLFRQLHEIDRRAGGVIAMPEQVVNPQTRDQYLVSSLINEAITSSQLEGAVTTREVAKEMIRNGRKPQNRSEKMILNNYLTMRRIIELQAEPLTKELVFEIHRTVTEGTLDNESSAGRFRTAAENILVTDHQGEVFHSPPPAKELDARMAVMCDFANGKAPDSFVHPVVRAILLHFWLAYDHPFTDGNGRTARALFYWSMLHHKFWMFEFISISNVILQSSKAYYLAFLYSETDDDDATYFLVHQLEVIEKAIQSLHAYIAKKTTELSESDALLRNWAPGLNHRQLALISNAQRHPGSAYTIEAHQVSHGVVYQTARSDLLNLVKLGLLSMSKRGRTMVFRTPKDFHARIKRGRQTET